MGVFEYNTALWASPQFSFGFPTHGVTQLLVAGIRLPLAPLLVVELPHMPEEMRQDGWCFNQFILHESLYFQRISHTWRHNGQSTHPLYTAAKFVLTAKQVCWQNSASMTEMVVWRPRRGRREPNVPKAMHPTVKNWAWTRMRAAFMPRNRMMFKSMSCLRSESYSEREYIIYTVTQI